MPKTALRAILEIANSSAELQKHFLPHVDRMKLEIAWEKAEKSACSESLLAALAWAKAIWNGTVEKDMRQLMNYFPAMEMPVQRAITKAVSIRYKHD